ncbi:MAG: CPBP family intramembrane metalloprotease [Bacteroidales bacterium]|jgi:membrane protease YdiL (CAAX protease family)|nr:CPBP family intramembrane metalloprotease [Bacteroidales bacterium]
MNFLERALDKSNAFWKYIVVAIGFFIVSVVGMMPILLILNKRYSFTPEIIQEFMVSLDFSILGVSQNMGLLIMLIPFVFALFGSILFIKLLHSRSFAETVNGTKKVRWNRAFFAFGIWFLLFLIDYGISYAINPDNFVFHFDIKTFIPLFIISAIFIPIQATCEEFLFRGYLTQGVAAWTKNRWLAVIIPGVIFGLMHLGNNEVTEYGFWIMMPNYVIFGLMLGLISVLDDGIELAIGIHTANNFFASTIVTFDESTLASPALFNMQSINIPLSYLEEIIIWIIIIFIFYKKYNWNLSIMNKRIKANEE